MNRFAQEFALDQTAQDRAAAVGPLLDGHPYGMAYLLGPKRAPVGYCIVTLGWGIDAGGMTATIDEFYIRDTIRGRGIAGEVLQLLAVTLKGASVTALRLDVQSDAPALKKLFEKAGFKPRDGQLRMTRSL